MDEMINVHNGQPGAPWGMGSMTEGPAAYREPRTQDTRTLEFGGAIAKTAVSSLFSSLLPQLLFSLSVCLSSLSQSFCRFWRSPLLLLYDISFNLKFWIKADLR